MSEVLLYHATRARGRTLPYTPHPAPYILYLTPYTPHPEPSMQPQHHATWALFEQNTARISKSPFSYIQKVSSSAASLHPCSRRKELRIHRH